MKPVEQLVTHDPKNNVVGDCLRACVASILELDIEYVPHFEHDMEKEISKRDPLRWFNHLIFWAYYTHFYLVDFYQVKHHGHIIRPDEYYIAAGKSPRGFKKVLHAVVGLNGKIVHDPHPDKTGIIGDPVDYMYFRYLGPDHVAPYAIPPGRIPQGSQGNRT